MRLKNNLHKKLLSSVFIIVGITILLVTALVTVLEKSRFQQMEFNQIFYETSAIKNRIGNLMFDSNLRYLMITLSNAKSANPFLLYFSLADKNDVILVSDEEQVIGKKEFETATLKDITHPIFEKANVETMDKISSRFRIYQSRLNKDLFEGGRLKAQKNEEIFDAFWDITYMGDHLGTLRMGFSGQGLKKHRIFHIFAMLGTGFFILIVTLGLIFLVIKKSLRPLDSFILKLSDLYATDDGRALRKRLAANCWQKEESDIEEIQRIKQAFSKIRDVFIRNWDQLENHRNNLEKMVDERIRELNGLNRELSLQIEERKEIETRLLNVQKLEAVGTLAGGVAHEFNNLFMAITGYAALIQKQSEPDHPNVEKAAKIRNLVDNGSQSIKQLLGFARSGKYDPGLLNINEVARLTLGMFQRSRKDLEIVTEFARDIWSVYADRSQMEQVVMNLLLNASDATPGNGRVSMETHNVVLEKEYIRMDKIVSGSFVCLSIRDEGCGIAEENIQRVFDPFYTTKKITPGTGLGLASVYGIINNHDGFTTVESSIGKGSLFSVFLPALKKQEE